VRFRIQLGDEREARGLARVVRLGEGDARACEISEIADADREALVRYTFDRQRAELRRRA
jgi:c-di-GMP-binding flagellar brake protein YcgR